MGGPRRPDDDRGRYRRPRSSSRSAASPSRDGGRSARSARRESDRGRAASGPFAGMAATWGRFRERPNSPQIIAGILLAAALLCAALGLLMRPSTALGTYTLPQSVSPGQVGTAGTVNGTPGSILAPTATPPSAPTATGTTTPGAATATPHAATQAPTIAPGGSAPTGTPKHHP